MLIKGESITSHGTANKADLFPARRLRALSMIWGSCNSRNGTLAAPANFAVNESHCLKLSLLFKSCDPWIYHK